MGNRVVTKTLKVDGLTCTGCETKIEEKLKKMKGIQKVKASYAHETVSITYDSQKVQMKDIVKALDELGYDIKREANNVQKKSSTGSNNQLIVMGIIILGFYLIIKRTIGFNFIPEISPNMGYGILFVVGLLSSLHCIAMCGGINLSLCVSYKFEQEGNSKLGKVLPSILYNGGRVLSYTMIGGLVGAIGSVFSISNMGSAFITIIAGVFMVIMGLNMLNLFPGLRRMAPHMPKIFADKIYGAKTSKGPFIVGLLNGLMPCGPLQAMQLYALGTGSLMAGALSMLVFSLGTVPLMFAFGALGSMISSKSAKNMVKCSAMLVIVLGVIMLNRGMAFTGLTLLSFAAGADGENVNISTITGEEQQITTTLERGRYAPITVQEGVPVKWIINADSSDLNGCNNEMIIPEYNIKQKLRAGENVITFTPTKTGKFGYSCWMGMISSSVTVVDDLQDIEAVKNAQTNKDVNREGLPASCCGL